MPRSTRTRATPARSPLAGALMALGLPLVPATGLAAGAAAPAATPGPAIQASRRDLGPGKEVIPDICHGSAPVS